MNSLSDKMFAAVPAGAAAPAWTPGKGRTAECGEARLSRAALSGLDAVMRSRRLAAEALERNLSDQLRWLRGSGRLGEEELGLMVSQGVLTGDDRLPCQNPARARSGPACGWRCPIEQRARDGDRSAPCIEAQGHLPANVLAPERIADDPVRLMHIRPCYILGRLAAGAQSPA